MAVTFFWPNCVVRNASTSPNGRVSFLVRRHIEGVGRQLTLAILLRRDAEPVRPARIDVDGQIGHELIGHTDALRSRALHVVEPVALEVLAREGWEEAGEALGRREEQGNGLHRGPSCRCRTAWRPRCQTAS